MMPRARVLASVVLGVVCWLAPGLAPAQEGDAAIGAASVSQRYERARTLARSGATEAALAEFDALLADYPNDADYLLGRAQMQARLGDTAAAIETADRALALAPGYEDVWQLRLQLAERAGDSAAAAALRAEVAARFPGAGWWQRSPAPTEYRRWLSGGYGAESLSNGAPGWSREFARFDAQTAGGTALYGELSSSQRFGETDTSFNAGGLWQVLPDWQLGAAAALTDDPRFLPDYELSFDATRAWPNGWGSTVGFRKRDYATGDVSSFSFMGEKYIAAFRVAYRLDRSRLAGADSTLTHSLGVTWYPNEKRSFGITLGSGEEIEVIDLDQLLSTSVANVTLTGRETFSPRLSLNWWLGTHEQGDFYRRDYAGFAVRVGF
jgi:YaiO family outer membrane protein